MLFIAFLSHSLNYSAPDFQGFLKNNFNHFGKEQILFINFIPEFTEFSFWVFLDLAEFLHNSYFEVFISLITIF